MALQSLSLRRCRWLASLDDLDMALDLLSKITDMGTNCRHHGLGIKSYVLADDSHRTISSASQRTRLKWPHKERTFAFQWIPYWSPFVIIVSDYMLIPASQATLILRRPLSVTTPKSSTSTLSLSKAVSWSRLSFSLLTPT